MNTTEHVTAITSAGAHRGSPKLLLPLAALLTLWIGDRAARGHEGHAALPTKGAKVQGDQLLLSPEAEKAIGLTLAKVELRDLKQAIRARASVEIPWHQRAYVTTLVPGRIERILAGPGDVVEAGQELAIMKSLQLETLQQELLQTKGELDLADRVLEQRADLTRGGIIPGKDLLEAQTARAQKAARLKITRGKLLALGLEGDAIQQVLATGDTVRSLAIKSPRRGIVSQADVLTGETVEPIEHLYHVVDPSLVWIVGEVLETELAAVREGAPCRFKPHSLPSQSFEGTIKHVGLKVEPKHRTAHVFVTLDNPEHVLRVGMFGPLDIEVRLSKDAVVCPAEALIRGSAGEYVLLERGKGKFQRRPVKVGMRDRKGAEILDGLFPGDRVVVVGNRVLASLFGQGSPRESAESTRDERSEMQSGGPNSASSDASLLAHGVIELPTHRKLFATSPAEGRIARILVEHGQRVSAGEALAEVESLQLRTLQLDLLEARAQQGWASQSLDRLERLRTRGTAEKDLWQLRTDLASLENKALSLTRQLMLLGLADDEIRRIEKMDPASSGPDTVLASIVPIRAPADGRIADFDVSAGQLVRPQDQLFEIHDLSKVWVRAFVFEPDVPRIAVGQEATVTVASNPRFQATGRVVRWSPILSSSERVLSAWIELDNPNEQLKDGMLARAVIRAPANPRPLAAAVLK